MASNSTASGSALAPQMIPVCNPDVQDGEDDDDLEALRAAALASMAKAQEQKHNVLQLGGDQKYRYPPPDISVGRFPPSRLRPPRSPEYVDESYDEEEDVETEVEIEVTDDEAENEVAKSTSAENQDQESGTKKRAGGTGEEDDVLNVDCDDEVDEFAQFLNEFENEIKQDSKKHMKKVKRVKQKRMVKRVVRKMRRVRVEDSKKYKANSGSFPPHSSGERRRSPMSPGGYRRRRELSPNYRYNRSPQYRRGASIRSYSRSPSPPNRYPVNDRGGRSDGIRFRDDTRHNQHSVNFSRRSDSAPRSGESEQYGHARQLEGGRRNIDRIELDVKSKSLPPKSKEEERMIQEREAEEERIRKEDEKKKEEEYLERLKRLPTPDRERVIARRKKFEASKPVDSEKKLISLKPTGGSLSKTGGSTTRLSGATTKLQNKPLSANTSRGDIKSRIGLKSKPEAKENVSLSDLRQKIASKASEPPLVVNVRQSANHLGTEYIEEYFDDNDRGHLTLNRPSIFERLGGQVSEDEDDEAADEDRLRRVGIFSRKREFSQLGDELLVEDITKPKSLKKEKKKEKKEKKKAKKEKKEKKKAKKEKTLTPEPEEEETPFETSPVSASKLTTMPASDDDLWNFFENLDKKDEAVKISPEKVPTDKSDILLSTMKAKNELLLRRRKEIEEDKRMHM